MNDGSFGRVNVREHDRTSPIEVHFFDFFFAKLDPFEKYLVKSDDFSVLEGLTLGPLKPGPPPLKSFLQP